MRDAVRGAREVRDAVRDARVVRDAVRGEKTENLVFTGMLLNVNITVRVDSSQPRNVVLKRWIACFSCKYL